MTFRVTPNTYTATAKTSLANRNAHLAILQKQASSGLRIERPSDDPQAMRSLLRQQAVDGRFDSQLQVIRDVRSTLDHAVTNLSSAQDIYLKAKEIAASSIQSNDPIEREAYAREVDVLLQNLVALGNAQADGRFLFGGTANDRDPFTVQSSTNGQTTSVAYNGAAEPGKVMIDSQNTVDVFVSGASVFQATNRQATIIGSVTGVSAGLGTDSNTGTGAITVSHTITTYAAGSGVSPGIDSATSDTVIGPPGQHVLTINDSSGTGASGSISLNGAPPVAFSGADTNLRVTGFNGEAVFVDTTSITPGFLGNVAVTAGGTVSVDGGVTALVIDFSANQVLTDAQTGRVTNVDTSGIRRTGTDYAEYTGTADAFQTLIALRDDLRNTRDLSPREWQNAITRRHEDVDRIRGAISQAVANHSVQLENLQSMENRTTDVQLETKRLIGDIQSADIASVAIDLQSERNLLEFTLATSASLFSTSLLDFLR